MEPEGSLPHLQVPATCPYPELARSSPYPHILLPEDPSKYHPPIYVWVSQVASFPQVSLPKPWIRLSYPPYTLHALSILFYCNTPFFAKHQAIHCVIPSTFEVTDMPQPICSFVAQYTWNHQVAGAERVPVIRVVLHEDVNSDDCISWYCHFNKYWYTARNQSPRLLISD